MVEEASVPPFDIMLNELPRVLTRRSRSDNLLDSALPLVRTSIRGSSSDKGNLNKGAPAVVTVTTRCAGRKLSRTTEEGLTL
jgi:hypothetical protein